jgi:hypothetical protein
MPETNEMTIDLPMSTPVPPLAPPMEFVMNNGYADSAAGVMSSGGDETAIAIGDVAEVSVHNDPSKITVYSTSISPVSYSDSDTLACFDVVFSVGINCGEGSSKTYQIVKRIGIDKLKIAAQVQNNQPVSVVENAPVKDVKKPVTESISHAKRMRTLAGLE